MLYIETFIDIVAFVVSNRKESIDGLFYFGGISKPSFGHISRLRARCEMQFCGDQDRSGILVSTSFQFAIRLRSRDIWV